MLFTSEFTKDAGGTRYGGLAVGGKFEGAAQCQKNGGKFPVDRNTSLCYRTQPLKTMENAVDIPNALLSLILVTSFAARAGEESAKPLSSRQINQETLSCPHPGNCVNSFSSYGLEALVFEGNGEQAMLRLRTTLANFPEARIASSTSLYLEVVFTTTTGFEDQIEFRIDEQSKRIDYRSRSKVGLYDFNKNRSRMQGFSASFRGAAVNTKKSSE